MRRDLPAAATLALALVMVAGTAADARAEGRSWHVRAGAAPGGSGTAAAPFNSLAAVEKAAGAGDRIVVDPVPADVKPLDGGIRLKPRQQLVGGGGPVTQGDQGSRARLPVITNRTVRRLAGDGVRLAPGATVSNLVIRGTARGGVYGLDTPGVTVSGNLVAGHNTSCAVGFVVQPFRVPTAAPTVSPQLPFGLPNGWAGIMVDGRRSTGDIGIHGNVVRDAQCGDGIDIRALGTSDLRARLTGNTVTNIRQGLLHLSILAIGMQAREHGRLTVTQDRNTQTRIGTPVIADCEGQFANTSESGTIIETVTRNTFKHGIGGFSCNGFEAVISNGNGRIDVALRDSTFEDTVGDMFEQANLGAGSTMNWTMERVVARKTFLRLPNSPLASDPEANPIPFNLGDCMVVGQTGGGNTTTFRMRDSVLEDCNNGLAVLSTAAHGKGPAGRLTVDIDRSRIARSARYGMQVAVVAPLTGLDLKVKRSEITGAQGFGVGIDELRPGYARGAVLDLNGGNCFYGNKKADLEVTRFSVGARQNWWGRPGAPAPTQIMLRAAALADTVTDLQAKPACGPS